MTSKSGTEYIVSPEEPMGNFSASENSDDTQRENELPDNLFDDRDGSGSDNLAVIVTSPVIAILTATQPMTHW